MFFLCSQSTCFYYHIRLYRHHTIYLLSNVHHAATQILLSIEFSPCSNSNPIVNWIFTMQQLKSYCQLNFHHVATQVLVMAPNLWHFILSILWYEFYLKAGSVCLKLCYCNHYLFDVVSTSPVVWSQVRWFFLWE